MSDRASITVSPPEREAQTNSVSNLPGDIPLSFGQERLWFLDQLDPNSPVYNIPFALRLQGDLHRAALQSALNAIVRRHEILRTRIVSENGSPRQVIGQQCEVSLSIFDLSSIPENDRQEELRQRLAEEARRSFSLSGDLLLRATLFRFGPDDHVLLINIHHIAADEWSFRVILKELSLFYEGFLSGTLPAIAELPIQYADYALWQREAISGETLEQLLAYWRGRLGGDIVPASFPTDHPRPELPRHRGARQSLELSGTLAHEVKSLSHRERVTPFILLLAAFKTLIFRYTGQEDITVGTPIAGRTQPETEELIGFFVNTLAIRSHVDSDQPFNDFLARVRDAMLGAFDHQDLPFEKMVEALQPERHSGDTPYIRMMFALESDAQNRCLISNLVATPMEVDTGTSKFDITFVIHDRGEDLTVAVEYNTDLFEPDTIQRLIRHFEVLLEGIVAQPDRQIGRLPLLSADERQILLGEWNETRTHFPEQSTLSELFEAQVARTPDAVALVFGQNRLTYCQLNARANQLAHRFRHLGVTANSMVGICAERSFDLIIGLVAIIKAGGAYVPLDPAYPKERLAFMIDDAQVRIVLAQKALAPALPVGSAQLVLLDEPWEALSEENLAERTSTPESLAYVIYTSGSTGKPKGVLIPQKSVVRLVRDTNYVSLDASDRVAQVSSASFDAATFEIWGALLNGAQLVVISREVSLAPKEFAAQLRQSQITTLFLTTALFNQLASEAPAAFSTLKQILFGGEAVDPKWVRRVLNQHAPQRLLHVYGPTETTTFATWHSVTQVPEDAVTIPIGRPLSNTTCYVLDRLFQPVPIGVPGELCIGGPGLALGYLNRPELTAERFVTVDFLDSETDRRVYRTGDLVRYLADGAIEFIGRLDHQVKIRGFRVEPGEIEACLSKHPQIRECIVVPLPDPSGGFRLVAYLVPNAEGIATAPQSVRQYLKERLPDYMIPSVFTVLESLPLTVNGKVDRSLLPSPERSRIEIKDSYVAPRNEVEQKLAAIWEQCLKINPVGVTDSFFDLGGHSLLAVRLFTEIEKVFGKKLPLATLFQSSTIEQLAHKLDEKQVMPSSSLVVGIQPHGHKPPMFWIHSLGGDGGGGFFYYRRLAELLGPDQPSFGIRSPEEPFTRIEDMAARYIAELKNFQPKGPYFLGGFCFGGTVAYEMARRLTADGEQVSLLALLDSPVPLNNQPSQPWSAADIKLFLTNFRTWMDDLVHQTPDQLLHRLQKKERSFRKKISRMISGNQVDGADLGEVIELAEYPKDYVKYAQAHWQALLAYTPQPYSGNVTLFRARKQPLGCYDPTLGWKNLALGGVVVNIIPGTHEKMMEEPNVHILARELKACLVETQIDASESEAEGLPVNDFGTCSQKDDPVPASECRVIT